MFPDCRAKRSRCCSAKKPETPSCSRKKPNCCPETHSCQVCVPTCENQATCEKPFLCQELNTNYWCYCRPPIHRDYCEYCNAKEKNVVKRHKPPE